MTKEQYDLYQDLESKWSLASLKVKLRERINEQLLTSGVTKELMLERLSQMEAKYASVK